MIRVLRWLGSAIAAALLVVVAGFGLVQTGPGKAWLAREIGDRLSNESGRVAISGLTGLVPFAFGIAEITVADAAGPRLTIRDARVALSAGDLLARRATLRIAIGQIVVARPGQGEAGAAPPLHPPLAVAIDALRIDSLALAEPVLGTAITLAVSGNLHVADGDASAALALARIDGAPGTATLALEYRGAMPRLAVKAAISEPTGSVLQALLHSDEALPLTLDLAGAGPLDDWHGRIDAKAGSAASLAASLHIAGHAPYRLALTGDAEVAPLLPANLQSLLRGRVAVAADIGFDRDRIALDRLDIAAAAATLGASGRYEQASGAIAAAARLEMPDLAPLAPLAGVALGGTGSVQLTLGGTLARPTADAEVQFHQLSGAPGTVETASATLSARPEGDPLRAPIELAASGRIENLTGAAATLPAGLGQELTWQVAARFDPTTREFAARTLEIAAPGTKLAGAATIGPHGGAGEITLDLADLARYRADLAGALHLAADFRAANDGSAIAVVSSTLDGVGTGTAQLDAALGPKVAIAGMLRRDADGTISAQGVTLDGAAARLAGDGRRTPDGRLAADFKVSLPRLGVLEPPLTGAAELSAHVAGPPDALAGKVALTAPGVTAGTLRLDGIAAELALAGLTPPSGQLEARFRINGCDATVATDVAVDKDGTLRLTRLAAQAAGARVAGALTLAGGTVAGKLHAGIPDLAPWSDVAGVTLAGSAEIDAVAGKRLELTLDGNALRIATLTARHGHVAAAIADPWARPAGRAELTLADVAAGGIKLSAIKLAGASTAPGRFAVDASAQGAAAAPLSLAATASLAIDHGALELRVARLDGAADGLRYGLKAPLTASWRDGAARIDGLALALGSGSVAGDGAIDRRRIAAHLVARDLPMAPFAALGGSAEVAGTLGFELTLGGTRAAPEGRLVIDGEQLHFALASRPDLPAVGAVMSALWRDGRVTVEGRIAGPNNGALGWRGGAPLVLAPDRLAVSLPRDGAVALHVEGDGDLGNLADLLPIGEDRLAGRFAIDIDVAGTVADPTARGRLTVTDGRYESLATGIALSGISLALVGDRERLVLSDFAASDGAGGSLGLSGAIILATPSLDLAAELTHLRVLHRDEGSATASGTVHVAGALAAPRITAQLTIDEAELAVPERLPQAVRPVAVVTIDSASGKTLTPPAEQQRTQGPLLPALALDVTVTLPGKTFVRGRGLDSEWRGRLTVTGTAAAPVLAGNLEVVRGSYDFLGKSFVVSKGTLGFFTGGTIDPRVDIEARAQSSDITAIVAITGTATQPLIKLSSEPGLPRDEILAQLLFGTSMSQMSAAQGVQLAAAAASLTGGDSLDVLGRMRRSLGLDRLSLGSGPNSVVPGIGVPSLAGQPGAPANGPATGLGTTPLGPGGTTATPGATALNAGKYVANGVYVGVSQGLDASSSTVTVTVDVSRHITVDTEAGPASGSGIGINWKLDY